MANTVLGDDSVTTVVTVPALFGSLLQQMSTLTVESVTLDDEGIYTCNVNNGVGTAATLNVEGWCPFMNIVTDSGCIV